MMTRRQAYWRLGLVLSVFACLGLANSIWLPLHKAPDEIAHYQYSRFIADNGRLPVNYGERQVAGFKSDWPPLYHLMTATLTGWSKTDTSPRLKFVQQSPRFDLARELLDTKRLANTEDELMPYRGSVLMWHLGRVVSIILSMGTIVVTFFTALQFFPNRYHLAVFSAAIIAFVPTFNFISSAMSDDPLVGLLMGLYMLMVVKIVKGGSRSRIYDWLGLGCLMGLIAITKYSTVILPVQAVTVAAYLAWNHKWGWWGWFKRIASTGVAAIAASGWWFLWVVINFHEIAEFGPVIGSLKPILAGGIDPSQKYTAFVLTGGKIGTTSSPDIVPEPFWLWVVQIFQSFWVFRIGTYPLGPAAHILVGLVAGGAIIGLVQLWRRRSTTRVWVAIFVFQVLLFCVFPLLRFLILGHVDQTAQGRHVLFPIATILPLLIIFGWQGWLSPKTQRRLALVIVGGLACWSLAQTVRVATYFTPPLPIRTTPGAVSQISHRLDKTFGDTLLLLGYDYQLVDADSALKMSLYWQSLAYADEDYIMDVRLVHQGAVKLNWSAYPINGRYPTRVWENWETIRDDLSFPLLDLPPGTYQVQLQLRGRDGPVPVDDAGVLEVGQIVLPAAPASEPAVGMPVSVDGQAVVDGVSLWQSEPYRELDLPEYRPRMAIPFVWHGQPFESLRLQWLLVDPQGEVHLSQQASPHFEYFIVGPDWLSGDYRLRVEVWRDDAVVASQETGPLVTVFNERPRQLQPPPVPYPMEANFAGRVRLLGYDLPTRTLSQAQGVPVTLYWQGLRTMGQSYTVFTKLLDNQQQLWAGAERLPADGYSTIYWLENEVVVDSFELPVADAAMPPGIYWFNVGLYEEVNQTAVSLPLMLDDRPSDITSVTFGPIKIGGPPPGVVLAAQEIAPGVPVSTKFGEPAVILLRGYSLAQENETVRLRLYWESVGQTPVDWSVFVHIRNEAGETVAQKDGPVGTGRYPTSLWAAGEVVADELAVPLSVLPDNNYSLFIGLYNLTTGERLPVGHNPSGEILLVDTLSAAGLSNVPQPE